MSQTLSTTQMVAELQRRVPIGLSAVQAMDRLNEAYRWICQRGPMNWLIKRTNVTTTVGADEVVFPMPYDWDSGKPSYLTGGTGYGVEIPYQPYDMAIRHQTYPNNVAAGQYSVWSYRYTTPSTLDATVLAVAGLVTTGVHGYVMVNVIGSTYSAPSQPIWVTTDTASAGQVTLQVPLGPAGTTSRIIYRTIAGGTLFLLLTTLANNTTTTYTDNLADGSLGAALAVQPRAFYVGVLFPFAAGNVSTLPFVYHSTPGQPLAVGATTFFQSPDVFDSCIIGLAESEVRRVYSLAGWEVIKQSVIEQVNSLIDSYHTTKATMAGLADVGRQLQEVQTIKAK